MGQIYSDAFRACQHKRGGELDNMDWQKVLKNHVKNRPLAIFKFNEIDSLAVLESRRGAHRFSFTRAHENFNKLKTPAPCIIYLKDGKEEECFFGIAKSQQSVSTLDSRVNIHNAHRINPSNPESLANLLPNDRIRSFFNKKVAGNLVSILTAKSSSHIIETLSEDKANHQALKVVADMLGGLKHLHLAARQQYSAIQMAIASFGLSKTDEPYCIYTQKGRDTSLLYMPSARLFEDNVIAHDARSIPGFKIIESDVTGRAVFIKGKEKLEVYTANRNKLETILGVDLIYINAVKKNIIMVQYKMLEQLENKNEDSKYDWIFRPDKQFEKEKNKMVLLKSNAKQTDYRLNNDPFYFKFVKRIKSDGSIDGMIIPLEHLEKILANPDLKGPKGGTIISYDSLEGRYLRETEFLNLIRAGYIGTHNEETEELRSIIEEVAKGNKAIVLAWQSKLSEHDEINEELILSEDANFDLPQGDIVDDEDLRW